MDPTLEARRAAEQTAIEECDSETIHLVGTVQSFGWLMVVERNPAMSITHVSDNVTEHTGRPASSLIGADLRAMLPDEALHALRNTAAHSTITSQREYVATTELVDGDGAFDLTAHATESQLILEFQPSTTSQESAARTLGATQRALAGAAQVGDLQSLLDVFVTQLRSIAGYDRVKAYRFLPDGAGEIVAESRSADIESYLGLRFPAFDIPPAARQLYSKTPIRIIGDTAAGQSPILGAGSEPVDLSLAITRGTIAGHMMYLSNMGLRSTMSLPIVVDGEMWGLFALHHREPRVPSSIVVTACELIGRSASLMIQGVIQREFAAKVERCAALAGDLFLVDDGPLGFTANWRNAQNDLLELIAFDGVALLGAQQVEMHGECPSASTISRSVMELCSGLESDDADAIVADDALRERFPDLDFGPSAGVIILAEPIPRVEAIAFFRNETTASTEWAGRPASAFVEGENGLRLQPRGSFDAYLETVTGRSAPWSIEDREVAAALGTAFERLRLHWSGETQRLQRERLTLMVRELNHRVRNILALVQSLVSQTQREDSSVDGYVASLEHRIAALAAAQNLLTEGGWESVELSDLVAQTVGAYQDAVEVQGPPVKIRPNLASLLSLVLHELGSNAAKYGALSTDSGRVLVTWGTQPEFHLEWTESGGPPIPITRGSGFGSSIIENALPFEFGGTAELNFKGDGVTARFTLPMDLASDDSPVVDATTNDVAGDLAPLRVLIVEDDYIIGMSTSATAERLGATEVVLEPTVAGAIRLVETQTFDLALLDANLRGEFSGPIADALSERGVPFLFLTGYGSRDRELQAFASMAVMTKPVSEERLRPYFESVLQSRIDLRTTAHQTDTPPPR